MGIWSGGLLWAVVMYMYRLAAHQVQRTVWRLSGMGGIAKAALYAEAQGFTPFVSMVDEWLASLLRIAMLAIFIRIIN